jgi:triosephosphate isomerase (TIM)
MGRRKPVIAANWKMNKLHLEGMHFVEDLRNRLDDRDYDKVDVVICPAFTALRTVQTTIDGANIPVALGAQNVFWLDAGAYTGEVSPPMLAKLNVVYVIVGHSERREYFGETDEGVNRKAKAVIAHGMTPIMCVGETLAEREAGRTEAKVEGQVRAGLAGIPKAAVGGMVVAYEPIWAIGTGRNATPEDAEAVCALIRTTVENLAGAEAAEGIRIQYGGSVKAGNIRSIMEQLDVDGALVGGASLDPEEFALIVRYDRT